MAYLGQDIPKLGFGLMRLPKLEGKEETDIEQVKQMVDAFMEAGCTYFDTARVYGSSEADIKAALVDRYPRESYLLATKAASWAGCTTAEEAHAQFDASLEATGAGYFDFYLIHNTGDTRTAAFDKFGMWDFVDQLKEQGKVKHIGFSHHDSAAVLEELLQAHPQMEFVQLQVNYADWEDGSTQSRKCVEVCQKYGKPVVIMEPVRGGLLANPPQAVADILAQANPDATPVEWALRFAFGVPNIITVLSGMTTLEQMQQNLATFKAYEPLTQDERETLRAAQAALKDAIRVPCTACKYCMKDCPQGVQIANIMKSLNQAALYGLGSGAHWYGFGAMAMGGPASKCIKCGLCNDACPQHINVVEELEAAVEMFE